MALVDTELASAVTPPPAPTMPVPMSLRKLSLSTSDHDEVDDEDEDDPVVTVSTSSSLTSMSSSLILDHGGSSNNNSRSGEISPSSICMQRKLSSALVTTPQGLTHDFVTGRPTIVLPCLEASLVKPGIKNTTVPPPVGGYRRCSSVPVDLSSSSSSSNGSSAFTLHPPPLRLDAWSEAPAEAYRVRGPTYLRDRTKIVSPPALFRLWTVDLVKVSQPYWPGLCRHPNERIQQALRRERETGQRELPAFVFAVNLCVPATSQYCHHMVAYFGTDHVDALTTLTTPLGRVAGPFFFGESDEYRDRTFKLIPRIVDGNFVVKKAVGSKPSILGRKLKQYYVRDERFMELIVDIGSDSVAQSIVRLSLGYAKSLVVDMMFVLEGASEATLPERILGGVRLAHLDLKQRDGTRFAY